MRRAGPGERAACLWASGRPGMEECLGQTRAPPLTQVDDLERGEEAVLRGQVLPGRLGAVVLDEGEAAGAQDVVVGAQHRPIEVRQAELVVVDRTVGHAEGSPVRQPPLQQVLRQHLRGAGLRAGGGARGPGPAQQQPQRSLVGPPQGLHGRGTPGSRPWAPGAGPLGAGSGECAHACSPHHPRPGRGTPSGQRAGESALRCGACAQDGTGGRSDCADQENCHLWPQVTSEQGDNVKTILHSDKPGLAVRRWAPGKSSGMLRCLRCAQESELTPRPGLCPGWTLGDLRLHVCADVLTVVFTVQTESYLDSAR